jgi:hypothetical protein
MRIDGSRSLISNVVLETETNRYLRLLSWAEKSKAYRLAFECGIPRAACIL